MSITRCYICEERFDIDYDEMFETDDYELICINCKEENDEL